MHAECTHIDPDCELCEMLQDTLSLIRCSIAHYATCDALARASEKKFVRSSERDRLAGWEDFIGYQLSLHASVRHDPDLAFPMPESQRTALHRTDADLYSVADHMQNILVPILRRIEDDETEAGLQ